MNRQRESEEEFKPPADPLALQKRVLDYLDDRFGLNPSLFDNFGLYLGTKGRIYLGPKRLIGEPKIVTLGIMIARAESGIKPTTNMFQIFGKHISKNIININKEQTISFVKGEDMNLADVGGVTDGYVLVQYGNISLGCALLKGKMLNNMMPKSKRLGLKFI